MKKKYIIRSLTVLTILATAVGVAGAVNAAGIGGGRFNMGMHNDEDARVAPRQAWTEADKTAMSAKTEAIQSALDAGNYTAWVAAVTAWNPNCPLLTKVNADNFGKYVESNNLRKQSETILKDLGIEGMGHGFGLGGRGEGRGKGMGSQGGQQR